MGRITCAAFIILCSAFLADTTDEFGTASAADNQPASWPTSSPFFTPLSGIGIYCLRGYDLKDARAAVRANDFAWLRKTSCIIVKGGLRVELIDAPWDDRTTAD